jgi:hypothetical protein
MPQNKILLEIRATKIEVTVFQPQFLGGELLPFAASDRDRRGFRGANDVEIASPYLHLACLHLGVAHLGRTRGEIALDQDHCLETEFPGALDDVMRGPLRIEGHLNEAGTIPEIEENDPAKISDAVDPATEFDFGAGVRGS